MRLFLLLLLIICLLPALARAQETDNLLRQGDLSGDFAAQDGFKAVPDGWTFTVISGSVNSDRSTWPAYARSIPDAWKFAGRGGSEWLAAGYQQVDVIAGATYELTAHFFLWTCNDATSNCIDASGQRYSSLESGAQARIGIDPSGGTDPTADTIVWSDWEAAFDAYQVINIEAQAEDERITIFLMADSGKGMVYNEAYWDDLALIMTAQAESTTAATPSATIAPTMTRTPTITPSPSPTTTPISEPLIAPPVTSTPREPIPSVTSATPDELEAEIEPAVETPSEAGVLEEGALIQVPGATREAIPAPPATETPKPAPLEVAALPDFIQTSGRLCVVFFRDANQNIRHDEDEILLAGGTFTLDEQSYSVIDNTEPYCVEDVAADRYMVSARLPDGFGMLASSSYQVQVQPGKTTTVYLPAAEGYIPPAPPEPALETLIPPIPAFQRPAEVIVDQEPSTLDRLFDFSGYIMLSLAISVLLGGSALILLLRSFR